MHISYLFTGEVVKDSSIKCVLNEGMPTYRNPFEKGRLIIHFNVNFPKTMPTDKLPSLEKLLPPRTEAIIPDDAEEHELEEFDPRQRNHHGRREAYNDDDDEEGHFGPGGQRVQCASQ